MSKLVAFPLRGAAGQVVVEMDEAVAGPVRAAVRPGEFAATADRTFEDAAAGLRPIAETILGQLRDLGPETVTVELGVKFGTEAGVILAKAAAEGTCNVTLTWKPGPLPHPAETLKRRMIPFPPTPFPRGDARATVFHSVDDDRRVPDLALAERHASARDHLNPLESPSARTPPSQDRP